MQPHFPPISDVLSQRLSRLLYRCLEELGSTKAALYLRDPASQAFDLASHYGWPRTQPPPSRLATLDPLVTLVSREKRSFAVNDPRNFKELHPFCEGADHPRFLVSPVYDRGEWKGLLLQRDPARGMAYDAERQQGALQGLCDAIVQALAADGSDAVRETATPPALEVTRREEFPPLRVPALPSAAMIQLESSDPLPTDAAAEGSAPVREGAPVLVAGPTPHPAPGERGWPEGEDPYRHLPLGDAKAFIPEQQTFFWESANLLCQLVPSAAVALWLNDAVEARPLLIYSRFPLSNDLKHQVMEQTLAQVPHLKREDLRLLARAEWPERDPIAGHFVTVLPVLLEEDVGGDNLLMLFRLEDRAFTLHDQDLVRQVSRMLGFYLQEARLHERYHQAFLSVSHRILASADGRIPALKAHSINTAEYSRDLARRLDLSTSEVEAISISAILHDVGTLLLDYRMLDKPRLTSDELTRMRTHPLLASTFLKDLFFPFDVLHIIRHHHEHWDGSGYPDHLAGEAIPIGSRIIHLVEAYEMMISPTPYRPAKTVPEAVAEMERLAGIQFDPFLVGQFVQLLKFHA